MKTGGIILLGVLHGDPRGYRRTSDFLRWYRPDLILVEISPFALLYRRENALRLHREFLKNLRSAAAIHGIPYRLALRNPRISHIARQLNLPFEYRAAEAYRKRTAVDVIPVDLSAFSRRWIETWPELISARNLETLLSLLNLPKSAGANYELAARLILGAQSAEPVMDPGETVSWQEREEHIAAGINSAVAARAPLRPVYIGGWRHLVIGGSIRTVRDLLRIGPTDCFLLDRGPVIAGP